MNRNALAAALAATLLLAACQSTTRDGAPGAPPVVFDAPAPALASEAA